MESELISTIQYISIHYYIDMLLFLPNSKIDGAIDRFHEIIETDFFLDYFSLFLKDIAEKNIYPDKILGNLDKIIEYIKNFSNDDAYIEEIVKNRDNINNFSNIKYRVEFEGRYASYKKMIKGTTEIIDESYFSYIFNFDYLFIASMFEDDYDYKNMYEYSFFMNKEYLCSVRKTIKICEDLLKLPEFKERVVSLLSKNIKEGKDRTKDAIIYYAMNNYKLDNEDETISLIENGSKILDDYNQFIEECEQLLFEIKNNCFIEEENFAFFYYYLYLTHLVYSDDEIVDIPRETIYNFIDVNMDDPTINESQRERLYNIMNRKRKYLKGEALDQYNEYLRKLNGINLDNASSKLFIIRSSIKDQQNFMNSRDVQIIKKVNNSIIYDFPNFKILLLDDSEYEKQKGNIKDIYYSLKAYLRIYPEIFADKKLLTRSIELLESSKDKESIKLFKKLKKRL